MVEVAPEERGFDVEKEGMAAEVVVEEEGIVAAKRNWSVLGPRSICEAFTYQQREWYQRPNVPTA